MASNPFHLALRTSLGILPSDLLVAIQVTIDDLVESTPKSFSIYCPLLLLPSHAFASDKWMRLFEKLGGEGRDGLMERLAANMNVTHIALNAPIAPVLKATDREAANVQRRPNIAPLFGDFGPFVAEAPTTQDLSCALWVSTRQNGITQTWAPLYTMFSRGNITEKARLLGLPAVKVSVEAPQGCTAVDMYAGIGYFVFSYVKAGCEKVLGFELNAWSVEGLRRGAGVNKWSCRVVRADELGADLDLDFADRVTVFEMSNEIAASVVARNRGKLPPVRHVNLGLLPTSRGAYAGAVQCLDPELGGWLHVHENFATKEIALKSEDVRKRIQVLVRESRGSEWRVELEHVERVKTYAPGVMHCVLDICVIPTESRETTGH
ncbi:uncharacterized protein PV09_06654 [Verruconis gallopava]|uniref:tRNA wybutosine-synthesizing protein 2 n=1 Tax=Verruconis gallopava TaxID=253628 RepID=A0A0D2A4U1_9PEZI|nr:uncharacterized protein PV09_06654 [Verruconis gallopava]KIW01798.1 hypothetical protein PV09_06654 [Verruconis gallopava]